MTRMMVDFDFEFRLRASSRSFDLNFAEKSTGIENFHDIEGLLVIRVSGIYN